MLSTAHNDDARAREPRYLWRIELRVRGRHACDMGFGQKVGALVTHCRAHLRVEVGEGDAKPEIQVLLPWLIRSRLERERKAGTGIARAHANAGKPTGADV